MGHMPATIAGKIRINLMDANLMPPSTEEKVRINRILMIDEAIRSGRFPNAQTLADMAEVHRRTILRDIDYLRDMYRAPIEYDARERGFFYTETNFFIKSVILSEGELFSLALTAYSNNTRIRRLKKDCASFSRKSSNPCQTR
jgi:predicted DNA-binding transcriptional regulator YafY